MWDKVKDLLRRDNMNGQFRWYPAHCVAWLIHSTREGYMSFYAPRLSIISPWNRQKLPGTPRNNWLWSAFQPQDKVYDPSVRHLSLPLSSCPRAIKTCSEQAPPWSKLRSQHCGSVQTAVQFKLRFSPPPYGGLAAFHVSSSGKGVWFTVALLPSSTQKNSTLTPEPYLTQFNY